jgi:hypothetical protein
VVTRLARQIAHPHPVLEHEHAITVQPSDHRAGGAGAEAAHRHTRLVLKGRAQRGLERLGQLLPAQHVRRLVGVELVARVRTDGGDLAVMQFGIDSHVRGHG